MSWWQSFLYWADIRYFFWRHDRLNWWWWKEELALRFKGRYVEPCGCVTERADDGQDWLTPSENCRKFYKDIVDE